MKFAMMIMLLILLQNWRFALGEFGNVHSVLLATFDPISLHGCLSLGFICFDGSNLPLMSEMRKLSHDRVNYHSESYILVSCQ